jgi:hypothetical protein
VSAPMRQRNNENRQRVAERLRRAEAYRELFMSTLGDLVIGDLEKVCFSDQTTFDDNPHKTAYNEGRRSVLLHIRNLLSDDEVEKARHDAHTLNKE